MQPHDFAAKWRDLAPRLTERAAYQEHWRDLCALLGERGPTDAVDSDSYAFEKHVKKAGTGETGFADVFKRGHFIAEYKAKGKSLGKALQQALLYARELDNPPLLIVSAVCFDDGQEQERFLGQLMAEGTPQEQAVLTPVAAIHANLSAGLDVTQAVRLPENAGLSFQGVKLAGDFDVTGEVARVWLALPNPGGVNNADVLRPLLNGDDLMDVRGDRWVIDFGARSETEAAQYLVPFAHVVEHVKPVQATNKRDVYRLKWWIHAEPRPAMRRALAPLSRYLGMSSVAKHRAFVWCDARDLVSGRLVVVASDQDWMHGVLNSRIHVLWAQRAGSTHEDRPIYRSTTCFEPFPFPEWTPETQEGVADAARFVEKAREGLRAQGFTLTGMYNALAAVEGTSSPAYTLKLAHDRLDQAVAAAYGWEWPLSEDDLLARLLALNLERAGGSS